MVLSLHPGASEYGAFLWHQQNWPERGTVHLATKLAEEAGEVCGAVLKMQEGKRTIQDLKDEMGDCLVVLSVMAGYYRWDLESLRDQRLSYVQERKAKGER